MKKLLYLLFLFFSPSVLLGQLKIDFPNGNEKLVVSSAVTIRWSGVPAAKSISLGYSTDNGTSWISITPSATGLQYSWTVPNTISTKCLLRAILPMQILSDSILADGKGRAAYPAQFSWSPTGATIGMGGSNEILDTADLHTVFRDSVSNDPCISFSPDGQTIILRRPWGADMISIPKQRILRRFDFGLPFCAAWLTDDRHFIGVGSLTIRFDTAFIAGIDTLKSSRWTYSMGQSWNSAGTKIAVSFGSNVSYAAMFDLLTGDSLYSMDCGDVNCTGALMSPDGKYIFTAGNPDKGIFRIWNVSDGSQVTEFTDPHYQTNTFEWSPDSKLIAVAADADSIMIMDAITGSVKTRIDTKGFHPYDIGFRPGDGKWLLMEADHYVFVFDPVSGKLLQQLDIQRSTIGGPGNWGRGSQMLWNPQGTKVAIRDGYGRYAIIKVEEYPAMSDLSDSNWSIVSSISKKVTLRAGNVSAKQGDQILIPIYLTDPADAINSTATEVSGSLQFNSTMLVPSGTTPKGVINNHIRTIDLILPLASLMDSVLTKLSFIVTLGNDSATLLAISGVRSDSPSLAVDSSNGVFTLLGICPAGGPRLVNPDGVATITSIKPNPASDNMTIDIHLLEKGTTKLLLRDMLGKTIRTYLVDELPTGQRTLHISVSGIPEGKYFLELLTPTITARKAVEVIR